MSRASEFFLNSSSSVVELETIQLTHASFSQTYYIVRNAVNGITATLETGASVDFIYYPLGISRTGASDDLDQSLSISLGDLGQIIPQEIDRLRGADTMRNKPLLTYRTYRSDDLTAPLEGPFVYELPNLASKEDQSTLKASSPRLNLNRTGEVYDMGRFPMLRAFL